MKFSGTLTLLCILVVLLSIFTRTSAEFNELCLNQVTGTSTSVNLCNKKKATKVRTNVRVKRDDSDDESDTDDEWDVDDVSEADDESVEEDLFEVDDVESDSDDEFSGRKRRGRKNGKLRKLKKRKNGIKGKKTFKKWKKLNRSLNRSLKTGLKKRGKKNRKQNKIRRKGKPQGKPHGKKPKTKLNKLLKEQRFTFGTHNMKPATELIHGPPDRKLIMSPVEHRPQDVKPVTSPILPKATLLDIRKAFQAKFSNDVDAMIKMVQLGFHSCVNGCDGCIERNHPGNQGLIPVYSYLTDMYTEWENHLSLADFLVIGSSEALEKSVALSSDCNGACSINVPFKSGRVTCENPSVGKEQSLPNGEDIHSPRRILMGEFGLSEEEMVAMMGAHSLGRAHISHSGFDGAWDLSPHKLDTGYFKALTTVPEWTTEFMPKARAEQWRAGGRLDLMMLSCDMILVKDFNVTGNQSAPTCTATCPPASTFETVKRFAKNPADFYLVLGTAYAKMNENANFDPERVAEFD